MRAKLTEVEGEMAKMKKFYGPNGELLHGSAALKAEGNDFFKLGKYEDSIKCYTAAIESATSDEERCLFLFCLLV